MTADLTDPLWGTGYGTKRHLVDMATLQPPRTGGLVTLRQASARCPSRDWLTFFADSTTRMWGGPKSEAEHVAARPPCSRCQTIADREAQS